MAAPPGSVTVPEIMPLVSCACKVHTTRAKIVAKSRILTLTSPLRTGNVNPPGLCGDLRFDVQVGIDYTSNYVRCGCLSEISQNSRSVVDRTKGSTGQT